jgi:hypothetical protein
MPLPARSVPSVPATHLRNGRLQPQHAGERTIKVEPVILGLGLELARYFPIDVSRHLSDPLWRHPRHYNGKRASITAKVRWVGAKVRRPFAVVKSLGPPHVDPEPPQAPAHADQTGVFLDIKV